MREEQAVNTVVTEAVPSAPLSEEPSSATMPSDGDTGAGLDVVFNRQPRRLSTAEAVTYAQQGLKWEQFAPHYRKLRFLSEQMGGTVGEVVDGLLDCWEKEEWEALAAAHPDDPLTAARLFAQAKQQRDALPAASFTEEERLAGEYEALCAEIPDAPAFASLPPEMWEVAEQEGVPLLDAYLRVLFREQRRVAQAEQDEREAAAHSAGSLQGEADDPDTAGDAFLRALKKAL